MTAIICTAPECKGGSGRLMPLDEREGTEQHNKHMAKCSKCGKIVDIREFKESLDELENLQIAAMKLTQQQQQEGEEKKERTMNQESEQGNSDSMVDSFWKAKERLNDYFAKAEGFLHPLHVLNFKAYVNFVSILNPLISVQQQRVQLLQQRQVQLLASLQMKQREKAQTQSEVEVIKRSQQLRESEMQKLNRLAHELHDKSTRAHKAASVILPKNMPEVCLYCVVCMNIYIHTHNISLLLFLLHS